ncbi:MAG: ATP synthase F1 subunit epsilon [Candidatus Pacebacteria bacterium CG10_big_fil_rev_8_21_14_0_10_36_11]|nr:ATP synthase F1 subunit epsilon [Candidatus Pacearchaeota archaeon]OIP74510.1 MAG: ATP synthase F1 subunit epsilon [Candidatus Pacebacteria bacterium CG2_30_36_39]PIR65136.1 MAG: ATP synthase F1 subunit epsilon [Candidatus Pacebacteria bacterium CG10_big_fil_rev_8_21_14_0_10_36_11]PJC42820.1 MAG: ATP synthase F1 subunit epsilon [Candidatus Pacebacteria bacterium CG_4_9_14_0_2_um_filter_36_8]
MRKFNLRIVSQERELLLTEVESVSLPTVEGEITVLFKHIPLFTQLKTGVIVYRNGDEETSAVVSTGFANVSPTGEVTVMVDSGVLARDISLEKAEQAVKAAHETMKTTQNQRELIMAEASLRQAMLEIKVAQKTHKSKI